MTGEKTLAVWNVETEKWEDPHTGQEITETEAFDRAKTGDDEIFELADFKDLSAEIKRRGWTTIPQEWADRISQGFSSGWWPAFADTNQADEIFELTDLARKAIFEDGVADALCEVDDAFHRLKRVIETTMRPAAGEILETNGAEFYVDGYTLASTDTVGEICLRRMDSDKAVIIKSSQLVAFLDRRFDD